MEKRLVKSLLFFILIFSLNSPVYVHSFQFHFDITSLFTKLYPTSSLATNYVKIVSEIDINSIVRDVTYFSRLGSRVTGYPGCDAAADYIAKRFEDLGLKPGGQEGYFDLYNITVPIDSGVELRVLPTGPTLEGYALWPNSIQACFTPPEGISGVLIYVREGSLSEFRNLSDRLKVDMKDSIVLMDFNTIKVRQGMTENTWLNCVKLGVKAIIFIEPKDTNRIEAEGKFLRTPFYIPRVYVSEEDGDLLKNLANTNVSVTLRSIIKYENVKARNIIGILEGDSFPEDIIIISAYYDSWSVVPRKAPGADEACGVSAMLELARILSKYRPARTVWFVAFSGHWQGLAGSRAFVENHYFDPKVISGEKKIWMLLNLDFSTDSETLAFITYGSGFGFPFYMHMTGPISIIESVCRNAFEEVGFQHSFYIEDWHSTGVNIYSHFFHDAEPIAIAGSPAFTFRTSRSLRLYWETPLNTLEKVDFEKLKPQLVSSFCIIYTFAQVNELGLSWSSVSPQRYWVDAGWQRSCGFAKLSGDVVRFDPETRWYTSKGLEDYDILISIIPMPDRLPSAYNPFMHYIYKVEANATFSIQGLMADCASSGGVNSIFGQISTGTGHIRKPIYYVRAYAINKTNGKIEWTTDQGIWGWSTFICVDRPEVFIRASLFKCQSAVVYDILDPRNLQSPILDANLLVPTYMPSITLVVNDFKTHSPPTQWGLISPTETAEPFAMVFVQTGTAFEVVVVDRGTQSPIATLINSSEKKPEGAGFRIPIESELRIHFPSQAANDMYWLNVKRFDLLHEFGVYTPLSELCLSNSKEALSRLKIALGAKEYELAYSTSLHALCWQTIGLGEERALIYNVTYTSFFFGLMLLPFTFLAERFFLPFSGKKRIISLAVTFIVPYAILYLSHPGFQVALSIPIAIEGYTLIFFTGVAILIIMGNIGGFMKEVRSKIIGLHFAEISRAGAFLIALSLGIEHMKKRMFRTCLMLTSITLITASLLSLTSIVNLTFPRSIETSFMPPYEGLMVEVNRGIDPVSNHMLMMLQQRIGTEGIFSPRAWVYPKIPLEPQKRPVFLAESDGEIYEIWGILGLPIEEIAIHPDIINCLKSGRWFTEGDLMACILSDKACEALNVNVSEKISISGLSLTVIGIVDENFKKIVDLNEDQISPIDRYVIEEMIATELPLEVAIQLAHRRLPLEHILIIPYQLAQYAYKADVYSIAVRLEDFTLAKNIAQDVVIMMNIPLTVFAGGDGITILYSRMVWITALGYQFLVVPYLIATMSILVTMLGAVHERIGQIRTFSSVGLAPLHVFGIFLAEAAIFSIIGSMIGCIFGIIGCRLIFIYGHLPEGFIPNFTSTAAIIPVILSLSAGLLSALYPSYKAAKLVTPSLERKWKLTTKPIDGKWFITMPFVAPREELPGIMVFMAEYFEAQAAEIGGSFKTISKPFYTKGILNEKSFVMMEIDVILAPFDANVTQKVQLIANMRSDELRYDFNLHLHILTGRMELWTKSNRAFIDTIRKQLLIWRGLSIRERAIYIERGLRVPELREA